MLGPRQPGQDLLERLRPDLAGTSQTVGEAGQFDRSLEGDRFGAGLVLLTRRAPHTFDDADDALGRLLDLSHGGAAAGAEADGAHGDRFGHAHGLQDVGELDRVGVTGGPGGSAHIEEFVEDAVGFQIGERDRQGVGQAQVGVSVHPGVGKAFGQQGLESVAALGHAPGVGLQVAGRQFGRGSQTHDLEHVLGSGPPAHLVPGADDERGQFDSSPLIERPDALGRIKLVPGDGVEVHAQFGHPGRDLAHRLGSIGVQAHSGRADDPGDLGDRLNGADLVVGVHDGHQDRIRAQGRLDCGRIDETGFIHGQVGDDIAFPFQEAAGLEHGGVIYGRGDDVTTALAQRPGGPHDGQVVRFASSTGEDDLVALAAQQVGHLAAGSLDRGAGLDPEDMRAGGIAVDPVQEGAHRRGHVGGDRGGGVVIEVDRIGHRHSSAFPSEPVSVLSPSCRRGKAPRSASRRRASSASGPSGIFQSRPL